MSRRSICALALSAALLALLALGWGHAQEPAAAKAKRAVYLVKHGDAKALAGALAKHFKDDAEVQAAPGSNCLLVRADPAVVEEVIRLLASLDRRPRTVSIDLYLLEIPAKAAPGGKGIDEAEFGGPAKEALERVDAHRAKGLIGRLKRFQFAALEGQPMSLAVGASIPFVTGVTPFGRGGAVSRQVQYRDTGARATVTARVPDEKAVVLDLHVDNSWAYVPEGGVVGGKDEEGKPVMVPEWPARVLTGKVSVPPGQLVVAKDVRDVSKAAQARTLVLVSARVAEADAGGGK